MWLARRPCRSCGRTWFFAPTGHSGRSSCGRRRRQATRPSLCFALKRSWDFCEFGPAPITGGTGLLEVAEMRGEIDRLDGASLGVVGGVEVEHHFSTAQRRELDASAAIGRQLEIGSQPGRVGAGRFWGILAHRAFLSSHFRVFTDIPASLHEGEQGRTTPAGAELLAGAGNNRRSWKRRAAILSTRTGEGISLVLDDSARRTPRVGALRLARFPSGRTGRPLRHRRSGWVRHGLRALSAVFILLIVAVAAGTAIVLSGPTEFSLIRDRVQTLLARGLGPDYHVDVGRSVVAARSGPRTGRRGRRDFRPRQAAIRSSPTCPRPAWPSIRWRLFASGSRCPRSSSAMPSYPSSARRGATSISAMPIPCIPPPPASPDSAATKETPTGAGGFPDLPAALQIVDRAIEPSINAAVKAGFLRFALVDGTISRVGRRTGAKAPLRDTDVNVSVDPGPAASPPISPVPAMADGGRQPCARQVDPETGDRSLSAEFGQLTVADIFPDLNPQTSQVTADIPLFGHATAHFAADGKVVDASVKLDVGAGTITSAIPAKRCSSTTLRCCFAGTSPKTP